MDSHPKSVRSIRIDPNMGAKRLSGEIRIVSLRMVSKMFQMDLEFLKTWFRKKNLERLGTIRGPGKKVLSDSELLWEAGYAYDHILRDLNPMGRAMPLKVFFEACENIKFSLQPGYTTIPWVESDLLVYHHDNTLIYDTIHYRKQ